MAFENAIITKEDDEKYGLSKIYYKYNPYYETFINELRWTIDRDRNCWLWKMYNFEDPNYDRALLAKAVWILYCDSTQIYVVLDQKVADTRSDEFRRIWELLDLKPNHTQSLNKQDILYLLKEILEAYRDRDLFGEEPNYTMELQDLTNRGAK